MKQLLTFLTISFLTIISNAQEVIQFELKEDNRIYIKGIINQSDTLDLVFDLGANITVINKTRMQGKNVNIKFDTMVSNNGGNGASIESKSLDNTVIIGKQQQTRMEILGISYPENDILDGIIGWNFFKGKKVMIDYESKQLLIYDSLPGFSSNFSRTKIKFINDLPYIQTIIYKGNKKVKVWTMLDTGYNSTIKVYYNTVVKNKLIDQYQVIGESTTHGTDGRVSKADWVLFPKFEIGGFYIYNMTGHLIKTKLESNIPALLGGNLLKRFHILLDFEENQAYLKPNIYINSAF